MHAKKGMEIEMLVWWLIALGVLVFFVVGYMILKSKGISMLDFIENLFRFGR